MVIQVKLQEAGCPTLPNMIVIVTRRLQFQHFDWLVEWEVKERIQNLCESFNELYIANNQNAKWQWHSAQYCKISCKAGLK